MRLGPKSCGVAVLLVTALLVGGVRGQTASSGALSGVVIDKTNAVVPDAAVAVTNVAKGTTDSTKTNSAGVYQFLLLASWNLHAQSDAFWISGRAPLRYGPSGGLQLQ
jgi:hypothetical protein